MTLQIITLLIATGCAALLIGRPFWGRWLRKKFQEELMAMDLELEREEKRCQELTEMAALQKKARQHAVAKIHIIKTTKDTIWGQETKEHSFIPVSGEGEIAEIKSLVQQMASKLAGYECWEDYQELPETERLKYYKEAKQKVFNDYINLRRGFYGKA